MIVKSLDELNKGSLQGLTLGTARAATGTSVDFTGIPSWAKRITVMLNGVSTNGTSRIQVQVGSSSAIETTNYFGSCSDGTASFTFLSGFNASGTLTNSPMYITHTLNHMGSNVWVDSINGGYLNTNGVIVGAGSKTLSAPLDRIRVTTVNGTDTFDAGTINIMYEG